jgi:mannose-6-phosphate isomerase-like protein (cupin superfamily)
MVRKKRGQGRRGSQGNRLISRNPFDEVRRERYIRDMDTDQKQTGGEWETKCWGACRHVFHDDDVAISYLRVNAGFRSSWHSHADRWNVFTVTSGELRVERRNGWGALHEVRLFPGESWAVPCGVLHRFRVVKTGTVVETYFSLNGAPVRLDDIARIDSGGKDDN